MIDMLGIKPSFGDFNFDSIISKLNLNATLMSFNNLSTELDIILKDSNYTLSKINVFLNDANYIYECIKYYSSIIIMIICLIIIFAIIYSLLICSIPFILYFGTFNVKMNNKPKNSCYKKLYNKNKNIKTSDNDFNECETDLESLHSSLN
jgi:hypothetical protein